MCNGGEATHVQARMARPIFFRVRDSVHYMYSRNSAVPCCMRMYAHCLTLAHCTATVQLASRIIQSGVRLVVWDFDGTIVAQHSHGRVQAIEMELFLERVSPHFIALFECLHSSGVQQAVATFSDAAYHGDGQAGGMAGERLVKQVNKLDTLF